MSSALQVEKTGRQRGVIVNESEERAKARIEVSKQEEGLANISSLAGNCSFQMSVNLETSVCLLEIGTFWSFLS